jgi:hypothetical protein
VTPETGEAAVALIESKGAVYAALDATRAAA